MLIKKDDLGDRLLENLKLSRIYSDSGGKEGIAINWPLENHENIDLSDEALANAILVSASLSGSCLNRVDIAYAFAGALKLERASLRESCWYKATLAESNFSDAQANKASFMKTDLRDALFCRASLRNTDFREASCKGVDFSEASLADANFTHAILSDADLRNADISNATFSNSPDRKGRDLDRKATQV